jgi:hypothetical protein
MTTPQKLLPHAFPFVLSLAVLGCSGDADPQASDEQADTEHCTEDLVSAVDPSLLIDDMEDANPAIAEVNDRSGSWWLATDMTDGTITPAANQEAPPERIPGGRCGSKYAMRVTGEGFTAWGATLVTEFRFTGDAMPIDATAYRGVMVWARAGESNTSPIRVQFQDGNTYPQGGVCDPDPSTPEGCFNGFGSALLPITTEWQLYKLEFSRLGQREFGLRTDALDTSKLYAMEIGVVQGTVFDFWVDDVWFYE